MGVTSGRERTDGRQRKAAAAVWAMEAGGWWHGVVSGAEEKDERLKAKDERNEWVGMEWVSVGRMG